MKIKFESTNGSVDGFVLLFYVNLIMHYCARNFDDNATNISNFLVRHSFPHFRASATEVSRK